MTRTRLVRRAGLTAAALLTTTLAACGLGTAAGPILSGELDGPVADVDLDDLQISVGSKNFTENIILGKMAVSLLASAGAEVNDLTNIPGSAAARQAQLDGQIDAMWEYTGTGWITYLGHEDPIPDEEEQYVAVRDEDLEANGLAWLQPAPMNNTYGFAITQETSDRLGIAHCLGFGNHGGLRREVGKCEILRLACIAGRGHAQQLGNAQLVIFWTGAGSPIRKARVELVGGHVFGSHDPRSAPVAGEGVGIGEVLACLGGAFAVAHGVDEIVHAAFRLAGERQRKAEIGSGNGAFMLCQLGEGCPVVPGGNLGERIAQHGARIGVTEVDRLAESGRGRFEPARFEIGCAEQRAETCIARFGKDSGFGMGDGIADLALIERGLRLVERDLCGRRRRGAPCQRHAGKCRAYKQAELRADGASAGRALSAADHLLFP